MYILGVYAGDNKLLSICQSHMIADGINISILQSAFKILSKYTYISGYVNIKMIRKLMAHCSY